MTTFFNFDDVLKEFFNSKKNKSGWEFKQIDTSDVKGYIIKGQVWSDHPQEPLNPIEPYDPFEKRPIPRRLIRDQENSTMVNQEPLVDVFEQEQTVTAHIELRNEKKEDIKLNITENTIEIKTNKVYKTINIPQNIDIKKATSKYNHGVLTVIIPKKRRHDVNLSKIEIQ